MTDYVCRWTVNWRRKRTTVASRQSRHRFTEGVSGVVERFGWVSVMFRRGRGGGASVMLGWSGVGVASVMSGRGRGGGVGS